LNTGTTIDTSSPTVRDTAEVPRIGDILPGKLKDVRDLTAINSCETAVA
jgi:hypothetical protein